ncbi:MAG: hypothetical protein K0V04_08980 [Deltaproteobacteria bacterium]|nr:hypothetical protein [Deltaproteobacteria bacterium]
MSREDEYDILHVLAQDVRELDEWLASGFAAQTFELEPIMGEITQVLTILGVARLEDAVTVLDAVDPTHLEQCLSSLDLDAEQLRAAVPLIESDAALSELVGFALAEGPAPVVGGEVVSLRRWPERDVGAEVVSDVLGHDQEAYRGAVRMIYATYEPRVRYSVGRAVLRLRARADAPALRKKVWRGLLDQKHGPLRVYDASRWALGPFIQRMAFVLALVEGGEGESGVEPTKDSTGEAWATLLYGDGYQQLLDRVSPHLDDDEHLALRETYLDDRPTPQVAKEHEIESDVLDAHRLSVEHKVRSWALDLV